MGKDFGQYEVIAEIGRGGMGLIYKAHDPRLNRFVAIKQLILDHVDPDKKEEFKERFRREAILAAGLNHPNCISIFDVSIGKTVEENSYYVMEFLEGHSFRRELEIRPNNRLSPDDLYPIFKQVCEGLSHAHDMNLVHRDIKPDNIFILPGGKVKLTDFGIARSAHEQETSNLTKPGVMLGTLSYVSPEQLQDARNVDHRADIYSLGVVVYEALAGQLPFSGEGLTSTLMAIVSRDARPIHEINVEIGADISAVVAKSMRKQANERYFSVLDFLKDYERATNLMRQTPSTGIRIPVSNPATSTTGNFIQPSQIQPASPPTPPRTAGIPLDTTGGAKAPKPWAAQRTQALGSGAVAEESGNTDLAKVIGVIGRAGEEKGCFMEPAVIVSRFGKIIVGDTQKRKLQIFTREGRFVGESTPTPTAKGSKTAGGGFSKPSSVTIDARGKIYATDSGDHYVRIFDGQGKYAKEIHNRMGKEGGLNGVICDSAGLLYVSDPDNGCVHVMNAETGNWMRKVGSKGVADGQLQLPSGLAIDRFNQLYVVDYGTSKVSVFSKAGIFQRSFGGKGTGKGMFNVPRGIAIDRYDRLYVADSLNHRIQVFSTNGTYMYFFGGRGQELGKFIGPADLSIDPENNCLYVADRGNCRVQVFELLQG
jgi:serine/threonine protein kinase/DNA-binding beta-propeller fold protein YncE